MAEETDSKQDKGTIKKNKLKPKKVPEKGNASQSNNLKRKQESSSTDSSSAKNVPGSLSYVKEIQSMMYGFGDAPNPLVESAQLIESILRQQMHYVLTQAAEVADSRGSRQIMCEDLIFLFRKDKVKLQRFLKYYQMRDIKSIVSVAEDENPEEALVNQSKKNKNLEEFLSYLDPSLVSLMEEEVFDEVKHVRNMRCEKRSQTLTQQQYLQWGEARAASFCPRWRTTRFRDWMLRDSPVETKPHPSTMEIFNYIAYEIVAQIVDLSLLVIQDAGHPRRVVNPELVTLLPPPPLPPQNSPPPSPDIGAPPKAKKMKKAEPSSCGTVRRITPTDIREVLARYWRPQGPFHLFSRGYQPTRRMFCF